MGRVNFTWQKTLTGQAVISMIPRDYLEGVFEAMNNGTERSVRRYMSVPKAILHSKL